MKKKKTYCLKPHEIVSLAEGYGFCYATDEITVKGEPVGYMYREEGEDPDDSGWRFFSGAEDEDYTENADNFGIYEVNSIANFDRAIIPCLDAPYGTAFERTESGKWKVVPFEPPEE